MIRYFLRKSSNLSPSKIRNVGMIDAGKTTATERMLFYSGYTRRIGRNTVTDYLPQERERGITIVSACIPLGWKDHRINLIDTPGHVDFTIEVERCVRVLDSGILILDGVQGVEAQTLTVWRQANSNKLPRIVFVNKMDREGSSMSRSITSLVTKLPHWGVPLILQWPVVLNSSRNIRGKASGGAGFCALIDLVEWNVLDFSNLRDGSVVVESSIEEYAVGLDPESIEWFDQAVKEATEQRNKLFSILTDHDDTFMNAFIDVNEDGSLLNPLDINQAIRRSTISGSIVPVFCGSAFKNIGIQPLLDALITYCPSPLDRPPIKALDKKKNTQIQIHPEDQILSALAFKIINDPQKGLIVFVRVYSGTLNPKQTLLNTRTDGREKVTKILQMYADDYEEIPCITAGNIAALLGTKETSTGDTLTNPFGTIHPILDTIPIPPPVLTYAIIPQKQSDIPRIEQAFKFLTKEDPSLITETDTETGDLNISGMGELHIEFIRDKLIALGIPIELGKVKIRYRESINLSPIQEHFTFIYEPNLSMKSRIELKFLVSNQNKLDPNEMIETINDPQTDSLGNCIELDKFIFNDQSFRQNALSFIKEGFESSCSRGSIHYIPVTNLYVFIVGIEGFDFNLMDSIRSAVFKAVQHIILTYGTELLEPIMDLHVTCPEQYLGVVTKDITGQLKGNIVSFHGQEEIQMMIEYSKIQAHVPLRYLVGYSKRIRMISKGTATFSMKLKGYGLVPKDKIDEVMKDIRGI